MRRSTAYSLLIASISLWVAQRWYGWDDIWHMLLAGWMGVLIAHTLLALFFWLRRWQGVKESYFQWLDGK